MNLLNKINLCLDLKDLAISIKWPNDIYFDGITKIGGVLVKSSLMGSSILLKIGKINFNVKDLFIF